jgi:hypothetical protein
MKFTEIITESEKGLWANIHAKRARIKQGSGEKMRKPGSKGAPSAQNFKDAATEDANPKRQAAIAIAKKEQGVAEGSHRVDSLVTDALKIMKGPEIRDAILALKTVLGDREFNDRRGHYNFYVKQMIDMYGQQDVSESTGDSPVADALIQHILRHRPDLLKHGADLVGDAIDEIASRVGNRIPNIGPREMNNWVSQIEQYVKRGGSDGMMEDWQKVNKSDKTDGMSSKAVKSYRRENPGSKLKTAVTTKPSKLKKGSKDANRRKSFCARMGGMKKAHASAKTKRDPDSPINKALRRWNCESIEQMQELVMIAEQKIRKLKK